MKIDIDYLESTIQYHFKAPQLLRQALTHRSYQSANNERLEFLGDSILGMVIAEQLFKQFPDESEGTLSRMRAHLVCAPSLADLSKSLGLGPHIILSAGEKKSGGAKRQSILADVFEAIIGAIYLDSGLPESQAFIHRCFKEHFTTLTKPDTLKDPKTQLQEWCQATAKPLPTYTVTSTGPDHAQTFYAKCNITALPHATEGESTNKKQAEQLAAAAYLEKIHEQQNN